MNFFYQSTVLSSRAVDGHQMFSGDSVVGMASTVGIEISPTLPLFSQGGGQKVRNLASFKASLNFEPHAARYPNSETKLQCCDDRPMSLPNLVKLDPRTQRKSCQLCPIP